ncbi:hypothetical protein EVAR_35775_1 [Eumeta japonica]|uniref:Uncharacterized protein n=1 Tax=Eumeta variegata TaxID=151549 RepID=A0A4C1WMA5_EUMVA|nr:hypothetical protein EVAR_35775_1 [Eumeta japonica]
MSSGTEFTGLLTNDDSSYSKRTCDHISCILITTCVTNAQSSRSVVRAVVEFQPKVIFMNCPHSGRAQLSSGSSLRPACSNPNIGEVTKPSRERKGQGSAGVACAMPDSAGRGPRALIALPRAPRGRIGGGARAADGATRPNTLLLKLRLSHSARGRASARRGRRPPRAALYAKT